MSPRILASSFNVANIAVGCSIFLYLLAGLDQASKKNWPMAGMWVCYGVANMCMLAVNK